MAESKLTAKEKLEKARANLAKLEIEAFEEEILGFLNSYTKPTTGHPLVKDLFSALRLEFPDVKDTVLLSIVGKAAEIKSFTVTKTTTSKSSTGGAKGTRKTYTDDFKAKAVKMVKGGKKKADVAKELDVAIGSLDKWIKLAEGK